MSFEDFDIVCKLKNGGPNCANTYKAKCKISGKLLVLKGISCENLNENDKNGLIKRINLRVDIDHPNVVRIYDYFEQKEANVIYLIKEYCGIGNLENLVNTCIEKNHRIQEEFACRILYQISFAVKTLENYSNGNIKIKEIFLDDKYNIKLNYFSKEIKNCKSIKMNQLGLLMYELCFLQKFDKNAIEKISSDVYSNSFINLVNHMIKDNSDLKKNINKILCNPTILMKSSQWNEERCFLKYETNCRKSTKEDTSEILLDSTQYNIRLEKLRNKELALQIKEQKLLEFEHRLHNKEKKIQILEKTVKEKLQQAELYLKRCKDSKSSKCSSTTSHSTKSNKENLDSTYVSCGDSVIIPVTSSRKINVEKIVKPHNFSRSLSERRVRFKGHSPLKDKRPTSRHTTRISRADLLNRNDDLVVKRKPLVCKNVYENTVEGKNNNRPISWTEENKKYAYDLLRMMNETNENSVEFVKHTHL